MGNNGNFVVQMTFLISETNSFPALLMKKKAFRKPVQLESDYFIFLKNIRNTKRYKLGNTHTK